MDKYNGLAIPPSMAFGSVEDYAMAYLMFMGDDRERTATPSQWRWAQKLANHWAFHYNRDGTEITPNPGWSVASWAIKLAGGVWTRPSCTAKVMDVVLAREFAHVLEEKDKQDAIAFQDALATARKAAAEQTKRDMLLPKTAIANLNEKIDAHQWASNFLATIRANPALATDEGFLIGWFANAIMVGFDEGGNRARKERAEKKFPLNAPCKFCGTIARQDCAEDFVGYRCSHCGASARVAREGHVLSIDWEFERGCSHAGNRKGASVADVMYPAPPVCATREETLLQEAERITSKDRRALYGSAKDNFDKIAEAFNALTGHKLKTEDVGIFNIVQKLSRECHHHKRDNLVDIAGYANITQQVHVEKGDSATPSPDSVKKVG